MKCLYYYFKYIPNYIDFCRNRGHPSSGHTDCISRILCSCIVTNWISTHFIFFSWYILNRTTVTKVLLITVLMHMLLHIPKTSLFNDVTGTTPLPKSNMYPDLRWIKDCNSLVCDGRNSAFEQLVIPARLRGSNTPCWQQGWERQLFSCPPPLPPSVSQDNDPRLEQGSSGARRTGRMRWTHPAISEESKCKWSALSENGLEDLPLQEVWSWS